MPKSSLHGLARHLDPLGVRAPAEDDADFLAHLYASTRMDLDSATADPAFVASLLGMAQRLQGADYRRRFPGADYLLIERGGVACGRVVLDAAPAALRLVDIALLPAARGQGLGRHILRALQRCAAGAGLPLTLSVHHANPGARRLYESLGFRSTASDEGTMQMMWNNISP
jgi:ribosomal protein S18 acetylase RimI-like enzyme